MGDKGVVAVIWCEGDRVEERVRWGGEKGRIGMDT